MKDTRFKKGNVPHNAGKKGYVNKGSFKRGHKRLNDALEDCRKNGGVVWNKGIKKATNTGRTRFKKGSTSGEKNANWKGGISKTKAYKNFYKKQYKVNRKSADRFTLESVSKLYQKWFDDLYQLYLSTKDSNIKGWHYIDTE